MKAQLACILIGLAFAGPAAAQSGPTPIGMGQTVSGELTTMDLQRPDSTYYDLYRFRGEAGQTVVITLTSTLFDGHLSLSRAGDTASLATDDNGAGGTNPKITFTLPEAGDFDIRAAAPDGGWGAYVLKLEAGTR